MVRPFPIHLKNNFQYAPLGIGLFVSIFALVALCAKRSSTHSPKGTTYDDDDLHDVKKGAKTPLSTSKRLLPNISNLSLKVSRKSNKNVDRKENDQDKIDEAKNTFGEGGLWQKNILLGEKCQPLEFAGVIYYDSNGNRISEIPRSPRISSVISRQGSFSFPASTSSSVDMD